MMQSVFSKKLLAATLLGGLMAISASAQLTSGIQFYDSSTTNPTVKFGWRGTATNGNMFITDANNQTITVKDGNMVVPGSVTANRFAGDGSGITNVAPAAHVHSESNVTGLVGDLGKKADTATIMPLIRAKADASGAVTKVSGLPPNPVSVSPNTGAVVVSLSTNSIDSTYLTNNSVGTNEIANSAVTYSKIDPNAIGPSANKIAKGDHNHDGSYYTKAQDDSSRVIAKAYSFSDHIGFVQTIYQGDNTIANISFTALKSGTVIVSAASSVQFQTTATDMSVKFLITEKASTVEDELWFPIIGTTSSNAFYSQSRGFSVAPGPHTFKFIISRGSNTGSQSAYNSTMTLLFVPD